MTKKKTFDIGEFVVYTGPDSMIYNCGGFVRYYESDDCVVVSFDVDGESIEISCLVDHLVR